MHRAPRSRFVPAAPGVDLQFFSSKAPRGGQYNSGSPEAMPPREEAELPEDAIDAPGAESWWDRGTPSAIHALVELAGRFVRLFMLNLFILRRSRTRGFAHLLIMWGCVLAAAISSQTSLPIRYAIRRLSKAPATPPYHP